MKLAINTFSFFVLFLLLNCNANGQALFHLVPDHFYISTNPEDFDDEYAEFTVVGFFESTVTDTLYVKWQKVVPQDCPVEWEYIIGDTHNHYGAEVSTNIDSSTMFYHPMPLNPSANLSYFGFGIRPFKVIGCCTVEVHFSLADEPDNIVEVATYNIAMLDSSCFVSAQNIVAQEAPLLVSPNPASESIQLSTSKTIASAWLFDTMGSVVSTTNQKDNNVFGVAGLPNGPYFLRVQFQDGHMVWEKIVVQH